jgi:Family of unknown function (DUF5681)
MKNPKTPNKSRFAKGTSGNPAGRPLGSRNQATLFMESLLEGEAERLIRKAVELALEGDTAALKLCLERLMPPGKDRLVFFEFPKTLGPGETALGIASVMAAISSGKITPTEGEVLSRILVEHAKVRAADDVERLVQKLEQATALNPDDSPNQAIDPSLN